MAYSQQACWHKNLLEMRPTGKGYQQSKYTPGLWKHDTQPTEFTLVVDDFGIKYCGSKNAWYLIKALKEHYKISDDWEACKYIGLTLDWDYQEKQVHLLMPRYVEKALKRFGHEKPRKRQDQLHEYVLPPQYGIRSRGGQHTSGWKPRETINSTGTGILPVQCLRGRPNPNNVFECSLKQASTTNGENNCYIPLQEDTVLTWCWQYTVVQATWVKD